jgi:hypothetical protein
MFSSEQYRAKAAEYLKLAANTDSPNEIRFWGLGTQLHRVG